MNGIGFLLWSALTLAAPVAALEPLSQEDDTAFQRGVHALYGCESCHDGEGPDKIPHQKIPSVCGDCHPKPLDDYATSVHWAGGKAETICIDCHGLHNILPVKNENSKAYRSLVCGECHIGPAENLAAGPHHQAFEESRALLCASCHSNHAVLHPTLDVVDAACRMCHAEDTEAYGLGRWVRLRFSELRDSISLAQQAVDRAGRDGLEVRAASRSLQLAHAGLSETRLVWHALDRERIADAADRAIAHTGLALAQVVERIEIQKTRILGLVVAWAFILVTVLLLFLKKRQADRAFDESPPGDTTQAGHV